jgi:hypothetical protein
MLAASGLDEGRQEFFTARFDDLARRAAAAVGGVRSPERRARKLHRMLHREVFVRYHDDADGLDDVLGRGEFNCVSSTLLEGLMASTLGLEASIVAHPQHVSLRLRLPSGAVDVETTVRDGFDARFGPSAFEGSGPIRLRGSWPYADIRGTDVALESGAAFIRHNRAERALARGDGRRAAQEILAGEMAYPGAAADAETVQTELARAFRQEYDAARFDDAYAVAAVGVAIGPRVVSARDRLVAAASQRIEGLADRGEVEEAEDVLVDLRTRIEDATDRFERHVLPIVVAAAVRTADWDEAECLADRYGTVEIDPVEARKLSSWVRGRERLAASEVTATLPPCNAGATNRP